MDVEQRARELLAAEYEKAEMEGVAAAVRIGSHDNDPEFLAIIAALTPPEGSDQGLLELAATFETCIPFLPSAGQRNIGKAVEQLRHMAMGYVLVPVRPTQQMLDAGNEAESESKFASEIYAAMLAARPEVKP